MSGLDKFDLTQGSTTAQVCASPDDIGPIVCCNLRRLRIQRGHSLERLAKLSGVSRAMLSQIEVGRMSELSTCFGKWSRRWTFHSALVVPRRVVFKPLLKISTGKIQKTVLRDEACSLD